jgi:hypothetical protein
VLIQITNVVQTAIFMVESHPRWFDYIALGTAVASEDASVQEEAQRPPADPLDRAEQETRQDSGLCPSRSLQGGPAGPSSSPPDRTMASLSRPQEDFSRQGSSGYGPDFGRGRSLSSSFPPAGGYGQGPAPGTSPGYAVEGGRGRSGYGIDAGRGYSSHPLGSSRGPSGYMSQSNRGGYGYQ